MESLASVSQGAAYNFVQVALAARHSSDSEAEMHRAIASGRIDWDEVWSIAYAERVAPLLCRSPLLGGQAPQWFIEACSTEYIQTGLHNALRLRELGFLLRMLAEQQIEVIVLKGVVLAELVYGNVALRPMHDIDLLVHRADVPAALDVAKALGYQAAGTEIAPGAALAYENQVLLRRIDRLEWHLELHWGLFDSPFHQEHIIEAVLWETARRNTIEGLPVSTLSNELMLLHLCGHLTLHHRGQGLLWWCDIVELLKRRGEILDWDSVLVSAVEMNLVLPLKVVVPTAKLHWRASIPQDVIERLAELQPSKDEARVYQLLTAEKRSATQRLLDDMVGLPTWHERLQFLRTNLIPSSAYMEERYRIHHPALRPLYYGYRWIIGVYTWVTSR